MKPMTKSDLDEILASHKRWLDSSTSGERANLIEVNLSKADLYEANLSKADLYGANLYGANLYGANLYGANLIEVNLFRANLIRANLYKANLYGANLSKANLSKANLYKANLWGCRGNNIHIKSIHCDIYDVAYTDSMLQIGCERHAINDWWTFSDDRISRMDRRALAWWKSWKPILQKIIKCSPAESKGWTK